MKLRFFLLALIPMLATSQVFASSGCTSVMRVIGEIGSHGGDWQYPEANANYFYATCYLISNKQLPKNSSVVFNFNNYTHVVYPGPTSQFTTPSIGFLPGMRTGIELGTTAQGFNPNGYRYACTVYYCEKQ